MRWHMCMCVCACVCMCMCACACVCMCMYMHASVHACECEWCRLPSRLTSVKSTSPASRQKSLRSCQLQVPGRPWTITLYCEWRPVYEARSPGRRRSRSSPRRPALASSTLCAPAAAAARGGGSTCQHLQATANRPAPACMRMYEHACVVKCGTRGDKRVRIVCMRRYQAMSSNTVTSERHTCTQQQLVPHSSRSRQPYLCCQKSTAVASSRRKEQHVGQVVAVTSRSVTDSSPFRHGLHWADWKSARVCACVCDCGFPKRNPPPPPPPPPPH